jgi:SEFIR domain/VHL beta domain
MPTSSRVFISYSHDSPDHSARVLSFASRLVTEGVDALLDQWTDEPEGGLFFWMERQIATADFVLLVCTEIYRRRVENPASEQGGAGVFWEANLIRTRLYNSKGHDRRFVPAYFGESGRTLVPDMLQSATGYQLDTPAGYLGLYRRLTGQPEVRRPALGQLVVLPRTGSGGKIKEATRPRENEFSLRSASSFITLKRLPHCDEESLKSQTGSVSTFIRFDNYLTESVALYWLNYDGLRVFYTVVGPGRSHLQQTYVTHPWVVTKQDASVRQGICLAIFLPAGEPGIAEIV